MKKHFLNIAILLLALCALCACSSSDDVTETPPAKKDSWTLVIANQTTRGLELSDNTNKLTPTWDATDEIHVYYNNVEVGVLNPESNGSGEVQFAGDLDGASYTVGQTLEMYYRRDKTNEPTFTGQKGTIANIAANFDFAHATPTITAVDNVNKVITVETADFDSEEAIIRFYFDKDLAAGDVLTVSALDLDPAEGTAGLVKETATVTLESAVAASNPVYVAIPVDGVSSYYEVIVTRSGQDILTGGKANKTLYNGKYYSVTIALDDKWQLWAGGPAFRIKNLDAARVTDGGKFYAWGETTGRAQANILIFNWATYSLCTPKEGTDGASFSSIDRYNENIPYEGVSATTELVLLPEDDAATVGLGSPWRMPTKAEAEALKANTTAVDFALGNKYHGINGVLLRGKGTFINRTIFLPFSGYYDGVRYEDDEYNDIDEGGIIGLGKEGNFWTATEAETYSKKGKRMYMKAYCFYWSHYDQKWAWNNPDDPDDDTGYHFDEGLDIELYEDNRYAGQNIRPVQTVE